MSTEEFNGFTSAAEMNCQSSIADDVWHPVEGEAGAYEWWYFDAISDDGRDALVVIFLADFIFSPRFNRAATEHLRGSTARRTPHSAEFPAVVICLYRDGRPMFRAVNEYTATDFAARTDYPSCRIKQSSFDLQSSTSGFGYHLRLDEPLRGGRRFIAELVWHVLDGDFSRGDQTSSVQAPPQPSDAAGHDWNLVAPRCRVTGTFSIATRDNNNRGVMTGFEERRFGGTGYHDHNRDQRWMPASIAEWQWGRAHFEDATAVFYRYLSHTEGAEDSTPMTRLFVARNGTLFEYHARVSEDEAGRHLFGLRYSRALNFMAEVESGLLSLRVRQQHVVDGSYFYLRFLGEAALDLGDGRIRRAPAISEHLAPRALNWRWLDWLTDMRIGRQGRSSFLP